MYINNIVFILYQQCINVFYNVSTRFLYSIQSFMFQKVVPHKDIIVVHGIKSETIQATIQRINDAMIAIIHEII